MTTLEQYFITYLESLAEDRAALAALRRGLGQPPGTVADMYPYVVRFLPKDAYPDSWTEQTYYLIAALYALHPKSAREGNLGTHFARTVDPKADNNDAIERRFTALLTAHPDDLHFYLRQAISFLKSRPEEIGINWHQLMWDILAWEHPDRRTRVQKQWAAQFWRGSKPKEEETPKIPDES
ncbi:MAG: type I-E CRISPR-associated protein Cse2/CasB [Chloroflexota bacterium]